MWAWQQNTVLKMMEYSNLSPDTALSMFDKLLGSIHKRVIVGQLNYDSVEAYLNDYHIRLDEKIKSDIKKRKESSSVGYISGNKPDNNEYIEIKGKAKGEYNRTELALANVWAKVFGEKEIDVYSSFYDLGGDSIIAVHLLKEINNVFPGAVDITDIYTYPSIVEMSKYIESKEERKPRALPMSDGNNNPLNRLEDKLDDLLDKLEKGLITSEEAEMLSEL